ncbi:alpha-1,2-mannosyltransferase alg11 [Microdochium trichocladiopsis]|uniref:GDP-Man:Man(3)GlcNAc(2)-PP-Dol alpha-1,2-mannosyltransferase n=1 Tax=Microdochium trichocladiopsis TaxID=1682393 RepID=A0A9P8YIW4_9PEZI|nr:alpha-1,2-mannosyltransferase alg11 [Microdochium trichocladiopsis]KAH7039849.1 alpha-1,2-mannosyltransferase alg11 [Microdochium trichocladiopsis]
MALTTIATTVVVLLCSPVIGLLAWNYLVPVLFHTLSASVGTTLGYYLVKKTEGRRDRILRVTEELETNHAAFAANATQTTGSSTSSDNEWDKVDDGSSADRAAATGVDTKSPNWDGIVGFFHPFCNAGGGGERVLWAAIRATQKRWPKAKIVVYTGDHEVTKDQILNRVKNTFSIDLHPPTIHFLYLSTRHWVLASTWPHATLLGQSIGSVILGWDAFSLVVPDIFVDTMGYAFVLGLCKLLFPTMPTGAYVHYPTISTDMLDSLDPNSAVGGQGVNAGQGVGLKGTIKKFYWKWFAGVYSWMGASVDVVMTNSSWTQAHIQALWGPRRAQRQRQNSMEVVYPPCAVHEIEEAVELSEESEKKRTKALVYIAQFRPEKNHQLIIQAFHEFVKSGTPASQGSKLVLLGSVRGDSDAKRVYQLRLLVNELHLVDRVVFHLDAPWSEILQHISQGYVGVNGMWNEHFGIGVVEYLAAGLIPVVHDSGGPKLDIVVDVDGQPTGFHATTASDYAAGFEKALSLKDPLAVRKRARKSAQRFSEEEFAHKWIVQLGKLVDMQTSH